MSDLRNQLKATPIKSLKKAAEKDNEILGSSSNEYLSLVDGKALKIRIFPAHPGVDNFYISKKSYWLSVANQDGDMRRTTVLDSRIHGGTAMDIVDEYVKMAKKHCAGDEEKLNALTGDQNSLNPSYTWLCYASIVTPDEELKPMLWEFKKMVRDQINKLSFSEDEDDAIETDPFTDVDEGLPVMVKYNKKPNKKAGENYYEVSFPKKQNPRPLSDDEIEHFMKLKPLNEILYAYDMKTFERALEGLQNFDEENKIGLFETDEWIEKVEEVKNQYEGTSDDDEDEQPKKKISKKESEKKPATKPAPEKKPVKKVEPEEEDEEETEDEDSKSGDQFDDMERSELKAFIKENNLEITVYKSTTDEQIREQIREQYSNEDSSEEDEEETEDEDSDEEETQKPKSKISLDDIRNKLGRNKK